MFNSTFFARGSIHQGNNRFSNASRGRQCAFMSISAILCANSCDILTWTTDTIDGILIEGDAMYLKAFEERSIPDAETISLNYLPDRVYSSTRRTVSTCMRRQPNQNQNIDFCPLFIDKPNLHELPNEATTYQNQSPDVAPNQNISPNEANNRNISPNEANTQKQSPDMANNTDLPNTVEPNEAQSSENSTNNLTIIEYKDFYQGTIYSVDNQNDSPYLDLNTALMNTFTSDNYALIILDGYVMALMKHTDNSIYVFDSHARNEYGMPDDNGTAVVMKCCNITALGQYLCSLAINLNSQFFEIMPVAFLSSTITQSLILSNINSNQSKDDAKQKRRARAQMYNKRKRLEETPLEKECRLEKMRVYRKNRKLMETSLEKQTRLDAHKVYNKKRISEETASERQDRLNALKAYRNKKRICDEIDYQNQSTLEGKKQNNKRRKVNNTSNVSEDEVQKQYLSDFENTENGKLHEQNWAKKNISNFYKSIYYFVFKCTVCHEAWPLKSKPRKPDSYVCLRCSRDKKCPKKFSVENGMIPSPLPPQLQGLSQVEEMLIARALPIMRVYIKPGGQRGYSGHCINLPQNVEELALSLPRYPKDLSVIIVKVKGKNETFKDVNVRRQKVTDALTWLIQNNPHYSDVELDHVALDLLPDDGVPTDLITVETDDSINSDNNEPDTGPPTDNPSEDTVYDRSTDMSSFLPVGQQQEPEMEAVRQQLSGDEPMSWPTVDNQPLNEYQTPFLATMAFPTLFPDGKGDPTNQALTRDVSLLDRVRHLIKFAEKVNGKWVYRFASHPRFSYWAFNMIQRKRTLEQTGIFLKQNPSEAHLTIDELREMAENNDSASLISKVSRYIANIAGSNAYWHKVKEDLKAIVTNVGTPTFFFTFSSADMHWPELHSLFYDSADLELSSQDRRHNVIDNPHIVDWFFTQRLESFVKYWLYDTLNAKWHWYRFEYQGRGSIHCHGTAKLNNDPGLCDLTKVALKGYLAQKFKDEQVVVDSSQLDEDIEAGNKAAETACKYVDWLLSTMNPNPPDDDMWIRPDMHPCQRQYKDIPEWDMNSDYVDLLNMVQRHTRCSTNYCLRKKSNEKELKCRFHFPFDHCTETKIEFEKVHSKNSNDQQYRAKIVTKRNDSRLNNNQQLQLQGWRANCDIQVVIDHYACVEYLTKYAAKSEPRSPLLKQAFNSIVQHVDNTSNPHKAIKKVVMKTLGERDYAAQETMHHLLSLKLHSSTFNVIPISLNGSRRVRTNRSEDDADCSCTSNSLLDVYANRQQYDDSLHVLNMNFVQFATSFKLVSGKLEKLPDNMIPRIFPTYSCNPKGPNFALYCKYQLLRYKPWKINENNVWDSEEPTDETFISSWHDFLQTEYAQTNVPDWFDKLQNVIQNQEIEAEEPAEAEPNNREEWMIISDRHAPFENTVESSARSHDWHHDRLQYTDQQIGEMPTWIKTMKEQSSNSHIEAIEPIGVNTFSEMQRLAYDIVNTHQQDVSNDKEPLCLIIIGVAGTGKSYLINALRNLLQSKCAVTATTGKASYNIKGVTIHSLLKLPVGPRGDKDLSGQSLSRLQDSLKDIDYILIDEYSMLGQTTFGWIDKRCKQATGCYDKVNGGISMILIGDPGQLPPVADKPLYHAQPSNPIGEQGYFTYNMFDKVIKLTVNQRVQGSSLEQQQFRDLLLRLRKGESTIEDWQLLLTRQPSNVANIIEFNDAIRLFYSNEDVSSYNHEQLNKLQQPCANINARHSSATAKSLPSNEMSGLQPTIYLAKGAKVMLTMNLWASVGLCNGATGTIDDIIYATNHQPPDLPIAVIVRFDNYRGPSFRDQLPSCVPICPITVSAQSLEGIHERQQLPLKLAYALTIHKSQGLTLSKAWIDIGKSEKTPGISYVAISRVKTLSSLVIEPLTFERLANIKSSVTLHYRLQEESRLDHMAALTSSTFHHA